MEDLDQIVPTQVGDALTRWPVRLALLCYFCCICASILRRRWIFVSRWLKWVWALGALSLVVHIVFAMHFYHHWSHSHAVAEVASQTNAMTGFNWGGGIYINYLFALCWCIDAIRLCSSESSNHRSATTAFWMMHVFLAFIVFNATVVFKTG